MNPTRHPRARACERTSARARSRARAIVAASSSSIAPAFECRLAAACISSRVVARTAAICETN